MRTTRWRRAGLVLVAAALGACGEDARDPRGDTADTAGEAEADSAPALEVIAGPMVATRMQVTPATVVAGEVATLTCHGIDADGNPTADPAYTAVTPRDSVSVVERRELVATIAGRYELVCESPELPAEAKGKALLSVVAGAEVRRALGFLPERAAHGLAQTIIVVGAGFDAYGNRRTESYPVRDVAVTPAGHHRLFGEGHDHLAFDREGVYRVTARLVVAPESELGADLVIDETPPLVSVESPARGHVSGGEAAVTVSGTASDNLGALAWLTVDGEAVALGEGGAFTTTFPLAYGLNTIALRAADPHGNERLVTRSVEHSSAYRPLTARSLAADGVSAAMLVQLTQEVIDDGDHGEASIDDLGSLLEHVAENLVVAELVDNPVTTFKCGPNGDCAIHLTDISVSDAAVELTLGSGRLHVVLDLVGVAGSIACYFPCNLGVVCQMNPGMVPGTATFERVHFESDLRLAYDGAEMLAESEGTVVELSGLDIQVDEPTGTIPAIIQATLALIEEQLVDALENMLGRLISDKVGGALAGLFNGFAREVELAVPSLAGPKNTIALTVAPRAVDVAPERLQVRIDALALSRAPTTPYAHLGSLDHDGCRAGGPLAYPPPAPVVAAVHDDIINQLLYALWEGGTLAMEIPSGAIDDKVSAFGMADFAISVDARLPPVFETCRGENRVQVGDLFVDTTFTLNQQPVHIAAWLQLETTLGAEVALAEDGTRTLTLVLGELEPFILETIVNEGIFAADDEQFAELLKNMMLPQLLQGLDDLLTFRLPSLDLGKLTSVLPDGTILTIDVAAVGRDNAYLVVQGALK